MEKSVISFKIDHIEVSEFSLSENAAYYNMDKYKFDLNIEHRFNLKENLVLVIVTSKIMSVAMKELACLKTNIFYKVANLKNFENKKVSKMELPTEFIISLNSMSISTVRGIMFSQFKGTTLHDAILPIVNAITLEEM